MQFPDFNHKDATFDRYKVFTNKHISNDWHTTHLVTTEQGMAFWGKSKVEPEFRKHYPDLNITVVSTTDDDCPKFKEPDGTPIKKAWLQHKGQQILIIDHDFDIAVRVDYEQGHGLPECTPEWLRPHASAWWPGRSSKPFGKPVKISQPYKACAEEEKLVKERIAQCEMWWNLTYNEAEGQKKPFVSGVGLAFLKVAQTPFEKMSHAEKCQLAVRGITREPVPRYVDFLIVDK